MSSTSESLSEVASALSWQELQSHSHGKDGLPQVTHFFARGIERIRVRYDSCGRIVSAHFSHRYGRSVLNKTIPNKMNIVLNWLGA